MNNKLIAVATIFSTLLAGLLTASFVRYYDKKDESNLRIKNLELNTYTRKQVDDKIYMLDNKIQAQISRQGSVMITDRNELMEEDRTITKLVLDNSSNIAYLYGVLSLKEKILTKKDADNAMLLELQPKKQVILPSLSTIKKGE